MNRSLKKFSDDLRKMGDRIQALEGEHTFTHDELFTPEFMSEHTSFESFDAFLEHSPWDVESDDDFERLSETSEFDAYVNESSPFSSWEEMLEAAIHPHMKRMVDDALKL